MPGTRFEFSYLKQWVKATRNAPLWSRAEITVLFKTAIKKWRGSTVSDWYWRMFTNCEGCRLPLARVSNPKAFEVCEELHVIEAHRECSNCNRCDNCCSCSECSRCRRSSSNVCTACTKCESCCRCARCSSCGRVVSELCRNCNGCRNTACCACPRHLVAFSEGRRQPVFHSSTKLQRKTNKSTRFVSNEIEVAGLKKNAGLGEKINEVINKWKGAVVSDGSLPSGGFEINTAPANGDVYLTQLKEICTELANQKAFVTNACGLHVHVDARDFTYFDIRRLIKTYAKIEHALFQMVASSRRGSRYCLPCASFYLNGINTNHYKQLKRNLTSTIYGTHNTKGARTQKYNGTRYNALNVHSWFFRGTIECRLFGATLDFNKISKWSMMWAQILDWVMTAVDKDVEQLSVDHKKALLVIVPNPSVQEWINHRFNNPEESEAIVF